MSTYKEVIKKILNYNRARGWNPEAEDSAKSIVIEAAELLELFQWDASDAKENTIHPKNIQDIKYELADIFWYMITFCSKMNISLPDCIDEKIIILEKKYPVEEFLGKHNHKAYIKHKREYRNKQK